MPRPSPSRLDALIAGFDQALRTFAGGVTEPARQPSPATDCGQERLSPAARRGAGRLMRVNHTGEVCAQALYLGQATAILTPARRRALAEAASEEADHLAWCAGRLRELETYPSRLNPAWFCGAFALGALVGACGEEFSMGFLAETERQVVAHLDGHLERLPRDDERSRRILLQMRRDEARHAATARVHGAIELPAAVRWLMRIQARIMTTVAARI
ncbi:MAG: 2-polyprenyl-3-methyl-6-methoxy-1,4-benzoquinone monooxygenase [Gammaproteobacteria bacterium]